MGLSFRLSRPDPENVWRRVAREIEADYLPGDGRRLGIVCRRHRDWTIVLDAQQAAGSGSICVRVAFLNYGRGSWSKARGGGLDAGAAGGPEDCVGPALNECCRRGIPSLTTGTRRPAPAD